MANKRTLKRTIKQVTDVLLTEAVAASLYGNEQHADNAEALLFSIVKMSRDFACRISHPEPGMKPRIYYKALRDQFSAHVSEMIDQVNNL